jgi:dethiobiotin synthetase
MKLPLIIVARPTLGTINHTLLTIHYALSKGIDIAGIVLNHSSEPEANIAEETNQQTLQGVTEVPIIGVFPFVQDFDKETIDRTAIKSLEMSILKKYVI